MPEHTSATELANNFSDFFSEKIAKIRTRFSNDITPAFKHDGSDIKHKLVSFRELSESEVRRLIKNSSNKHCELDPAPSFLIKNCIDIVTPTIRNIINKSLSTSQFPTACKQAVVRPLLKKSGLDPVMKNYRPVSNLSWISKLIEKAAGDQLSKHAQANETSEIMQSAYKAYHSTETAIMWIFNVLLTQLDKGNAVLMALLDLSAAFDTVDHTILKRRLQMTHGIDGKALEWVASYLSNRTMRVCVDGEYSHDLSLDVSLPQGSQLGPRFYSDYTQPMGRLIRIIELLFSGFADDTQLLKPVTSPADIPSALEHLSNGIRRIGTWMYDNKLKLNPDKTEFLSLLAKETSRNTMCKVLFLMTKSLQDQRRQEIWGSP